MWMLISFLKGGTSDKVLNNACSVKEGLFVTTIRPDHFFI